MLIAKGSFDVTVTPQAAQEGVGDPVIARMAINKIFNGDMRGSGRGQMLAYRAPDNGTAVYIALENVEGLLNGRRGSFVLQHHGAMGHGQQQLTIDIVADSGSGELQGIRGRMSLQIEQGKHFYQFEYTLP